MFHHLLYPYLLFDFLMRACISMNTFYFGLFFCFFTVIICIVIFWFVGGLEFVMGVGYKNHVYEAVNDRDKFPKSSFIIDSRPLSVLFMYSLKSRSSIQYGHDDCSFIICDMYIIFTIS
jgi:hypothetical protein